MLKNIAFILTFLFLSSCNSDDNTEEIKEIECISGEKQFYDVLSKININCFDNQSNSPFQGQVFSTLEIKQDRFESCVDGIFTLNGYTENIITFKNITNKTVSFDYKITQNLNGNIREYQGYVNNLGPNEVNENNTGDNTFYNLKNSQVVIQFANIGYN